MLQPVNTTRAPEHVLHDSVLSAMETGNHAGARTALTEMREVAPAYYQRVRLEVLQDYGVAL